MSDVGHEQPRKRMGQLFPLSDTKKEQREYGKSLEARPLEEVFQPLKERTGKDLLAVWKRNYDGEASDKPPEKDSEKYFDPNAKNRKYYPYEWYDTRDKITKHYLVVEEDQIGENSNLCVLAVFDKNPWKVIFCEGLETRTIPYIYLERLYLINKEAEKAIELASPWWKLPVDRDDPLVSSEERRIGFFPRDVNMTGEMYEAFVKTNNIILTDTQSDRLWFFSSAVGEGKAPFLPRWMAYSLAGAEATQKERDIKYPQGLLGSLLAATMVQEEIRLAEENIDPSLDDSLRLAVKELKHPRTNIIPTTTYERLTALMIYGPQSLTNNPFLEKLAMLVLIRLKRNALAATFRVLGHLRSQGFDLTSGMSLAQLREEGRRILQFYDELYEKDLKELGIKASFSLGDRTAKASNEKA